MSGRYIVAALPTGPLSTAYQELTRAAKWHRRVRWTLLGLFTLLWFIPAVFAAWWGLSRIGQTPGADITLQTYLMLVFLFLAVGTGVWANVQMASGARLSAHLVLWLRKFHRRDSSLARFRDKLARLTPVSFAITLRDTRLLGTPTDGLERLRVVMYAAVAIAALVPLAWPVATSVCQHSSDLCNLILLPTEILGPRSWLVPVTPADVMGAIGMWAMIALEVIFIVTYFVIGPYFGFSRAQSIEGLTRWLTKKQTRKTDCLTYVVQTNDENWHDVVRILYSRATLVAFDLSESSANIESELALVGEQPARVCFFRSAHAEEIHATMASFQTYLTERLPPEIAGQLTYSCVARSGLFKVAAEQAAFAVSSSMSGLKDPK